MNILFRVVAIGLGLCFAFPAPAAESAARVKEGKEKSKPTYRLVESGPHHSVFESVSSSPPAKSLEDLPAGRYTELATGLNRFDEKRGEWVRAEAVFEMASGGRVVARRTQHRLILPADLTQEPIDMLCPDGTRLISAPLGLALLDLSTGESVLIGELKSSAASLATPSTVVYQDCFSGIRADLVYDLQLGSIEQDLVLREQLPPPEEFGMDPDHVRVQVLTEFFEAPEPDRTPRIVKAASERERKARRVAIDLVDEELGFGASMRMLRGRAFSVGEIESADGPEVGVPVGKSFEKLEGRRFLVESSDYGDLRSRLRGLPRPRRAGAEAGYRSAQIEPGTQLRRLPRREAQTPEWARRAFAERMAEQQWASIFDLDLPELSARQYLAKSGDGLVLDYTLNSGQPDFVFEGGETYYVTGWVSLSGTTTLEGGAVIKYSPIESGLSGVMIAGPLDCRTSAYRPAILTARDDDTVGTQLSDSSGIPDGRYGYFPLWCYYGDAPQLVEHVIVRFATWGILFSGTQDHTLRHSRVIGVQSAIAACYNSGTLKVENVLVAGGGHGYRAFYTQSGTARIEAEQVTIRDFDRLADYDSAITLKNSLLVGVANANGFSSDSTERVGDDTGVFAPAGAGAHYLPPGSPYRDCGTASIDPELLADIASMTTSRPELLSGPIVEDTVLAPRAIRDVDTPDLGYHYPALDYLVSDVAIAGAHLRLQEGVAIAARGHTGFLLSAGARITSVGCPTRLNRLVFHTVAQEQYDPEGAPGFNRRLIQGEPPFVAVPEVDLRFTEISMMSRGLPGNRLVSSLFEPVTLRMTDCRVLNASVYVFGSGTQRTTVELANNIFEHGSIECWQGYSFGSHPVDLRLNNNLFRKGLLWLVYRDPVGDWDIRDNLVDESDIVWLEYDAAYSLPATHNAFCGIPGFGLNQYYPAVCDYQPGPLGYYYYPASGAGLAGLIDAGSRFADAAGLYHHTTRAASDSEGYSVVDIGFHYVGMSGDGAGVTDTDQDGLPDCQEDLNGNGAYDPSEGETDWLTPEGYVGEPPKLIVFTELEPTP